MGSCKCVRRLLLLLLLLLFPFHPNNNKRAVITSFKSQKIFPNIFTNNQCDQIGQFFKVLGNKFTLKSSPKRLLTFGLFRKRSINVKLLWILFRQLLKKIEQLFKSSIWSHWHGWLIFLCLSSIRFVQRFTFESRQVKILCN